MIYALMGGDSPFTAAADVKANSSGAIRTTSPYFSLSFLYVKPESPNIMCQDMGIGEAAHNFGPGNFDKGWKYIL